jgi:hypothetical protein
MKSIAFHLTRPSHQLARGIASLTNNFDFNNFPLYNIDSHAQNPVWQDQIQRLWSRKWF